MNILATVTPQGGIHRYRVDEQPVGASVLLTVMLLLCVSNAFGQEQTLQRSVTHDGATQTYTLFVPSTYSPGTESPLVLSLHGQGGTGDLQMVTSGMSSVAEEHGFLVAYPTAAVNGDWSISADHSISFVDSLLEDIEADFTVDSSRIYSTGFSQGGIMSYLLAVTRPNTFAAIASVSGTRPILPDGLFPASIPRVAPRPFPLMHVHGTADAVVPLSGGNSVLTLPDGTPIPFPNTEDLLGEWALANGCDSTTAGTDLPNVSMIDDSTVTRLSFTSCDLYPTATGDDLTASVEFLKVNNGAHSWPVLEDLREVNLGAVEDVVGVGARAASIPLNSDFSASEEIWSFFDQHALAVPEPSSALLLFCAVGFLGAMRARRSPTGSFMSAS